MLPPSIHFIRHFRRLRRATTEGEELKVLFFAKLFSLVKRKKLSSLLVKLFSPKEKRLKEGSLNDRSMQVVT